MIKDFTNRHGEVPMFINIKKKDYLLNIRNITHFRWIEYRGGFETTEHGEYDYKVHKVEELEIHFTNGEKITVHDEGKEIFNRIAESFQ